MRLCRECGAALPGAEWHCSACDWLAPLREGVPNLLADAAPVVEGYTSRQSHDLGAVDPAHFWYAARNRLIVWAIGRDAPDARTLLDVGCGPGHVLRALAADLPGLHLTGAEVSIDALRLAAVAAPAAELVCADTRSLPYDREFDVVGAFDVLEHLKDHDEALRAIARAARPGGTVLLTVPQHQALWSPLDDYSGHQRRYSRAELVALAEGAGLTVLHATSFVTLLLPAMVLSRLVQRRAEVVPDREFRMSGRVNGLAMGVMRAELALIRAGLSLPVGGSLLLVARRP